MSQGPIVLPTTGQLPGLTLAQSINLAFNALASCFTGPAAPASPVANQYWADTTNYLLKQRNSANSAWLTRGALDVNNFGMLPASYFRCHAAATPNMTILVDAGKMQNGLTKASQEQQTTATFAAPSANPRNDLIVIDSTSAAYSIVTGTEAATPSDPAIPSNKIAVGRVRMTVGMTSITDSAIDDIRPSLYVTPSSGTGAQLSGPTSIYISSTGVFSITNFDVFSTYGVAVSAGSVSISYDQITITAPATAQTIQLTITVNGVAGTPVSIPITSSGIIGVCLTTAGGNGGAWTWVDANGNTTMPPASAYFSAHPVFGGIADQTVDGQNMVKVPKFYTKTGTISGGANNGKKARWIADVATTGFTIHPAFRDAGADINQFYYGKYQASSDGTKLKSVAGVAPVVNITLTAAIAQAAARNTGGVTGFMELSAFQLSAVQWLYLIENGTMDSQTKTGRGRVDASSAANVDAADVAQATYRGIVGLWGNVYQWLDGLKTVAANGGAISLWDKNGNKTWVNTGKIPGSLAAWAYPLTFAEDTGTGYNLADVFLYDTSLSVNSGATATDGQYFSAVADYFPIVGGYWSLASVAGLWYVYCGVAASYSDTVLGARLAKV